MIVYLPPHARRHPHLYQWLQHSTTIVAINNTLTLQDLRQHFPDTKITDTPSLQNNILHFSTKITNFIYYPEDHHILATPVHTHSHPVDVETQVVQLLNYSLAGKLNNKQLYSSRIIKARNRVQGSVLKGIVFCFFLLIMLHVIVCKSALKCFSYLNHILKPIGYIPLGLVQNQMILKCRMLNDLESSLCLLFEGSSSYQCVLNNYLKVLNILTLMILDTALGLASIFVTYYSIQLLLSSLKYITLTLHVLLITHQQEITSLKKVLSCNTLYSSLLEKLFSLLLQGYKHHLNPNVDSQWFFNVFIVTGYLGVSFQTLSTVEFSYLTNINIFLLYKIVAATYEATLKGIRFCAMVVFYDEEKNITLVIPSWCKEPWARIVSCVLLILLGLTLPLTLVYYSWLVAVMVLFKIFTNILISTVNIFNSLPLGAILEISKKPHLYPYHFKYSMTNQTVVIRTHQQSRITLILGLLSQALWNNTSILSVSLLKSILVGKDILTQPPLIFQCHHTNNFRRLLRHLMML